MLEKPLPSACLNLLPWDKISAVLRVLLTVPSVSNCLSLHVCTRFWLWLPMTHLLLCVAENQLKESKLACSLSLQITSPCLIVMALKLSAWKRSCDLSKVGKGCSAPTGAARSLKSKQALTLLMFLLRHNPGEGLETIADDPMNLESQGSDM